MYAPAYFDSGFVQSAITDGLTPDSKRQKLDAVTQAMKTAEQGSPTRSDPEAGLALAALTLGHAAAHEPPQSQFTVCM